MHLLPAPPPAPATGTDRILQRDTAVALVSTALLLSALAATTAWWAGFGPWYIPKALAVFALCAACLWRVLPDHAPHARFGVANHLTLLRLALATLLAAAIGEDTIDRPQLAWAAVVLATATAALDAADGPIARRRRQASAFGARFDMETDALLVLVLSVLVQQTGKAGAWILAAGAMRYLFVLAARPMPWLALPLPASLRRKTVCVVQIVGLIVCLGPVIPPAWSSAVAAATLGTLTWSFAIDVLWLVRHRSTRTGTT